jgi:hypothetical protein
MQFDQNGYHFTDEDEPAIGLNEWCKHKKVDASAFIASKNDYKEIVLFDEKGLPVFSSHKMEDVACHIDMMAVYKQHFDGKDKTDD